MYKQAANEWTSTMIQNKRTRATTCSRNHEVQLLNIEIHPPDCLLTVLWFNRDAAELAIPLEPYILLFLLVYFYYFLSLSILGPQDG